MCQLKSTVEAKEARTAPPLGPLLAQFQLDMLKVCKELNELTKNYESGVPLPVKIEIDEWKLYVIGLGAPRFQFLYEQLMYDKKSINILMFYDLVRLFSFYHNKKINSALVSELLASLSSMKVKKIKNVK